MKQSPSSGWIKENENILKTEDTAQETGRCLFVSDIQGAWAAGYRDTSVFIFPELFSETGTKLADPSFSIFPPNFQKPVREYNTIEKKITREGIMKNRKMITALSLATILTFAFSATTLAAPPDMPGGEGGGPGGGSSSDVSWTGATTITTETEETGKNYASTQADENAVLVDTDKTVTLNNAVVTKSGGESASDTYSFYGINSAVMAKGGATLNLSGGTITTDAAGANAVFSYGANSGKTNAVGDGTTVNVSDMTIKTSGNGSGGIMTTYGGTTNASNLTIETSGGSSAPIRTDRGGGWVTVDGGT